MIIRLFVFLLAAIGVGSSFFGGFMSINALLYFTIQSNITIAAVAFAFFVIDILCLIKKKEYQIPRCLYIIKFLFTVAISLTFLVFWTMLAPTIAGSYLYSLQNVTCHTAVPVLAIIDWLLFSDGFESKKFDFLYGTAMPLYYLAFSMICSFSGIVFDERGTKVPYFFLDYEQNTWFSIGNGKIGVFYWIIVVVCIVLIISIVLLKAHSAILKRRNNRG